MIVTIFRSRLLPGFKEEYVALVDRMQEIARTIPGYISHKGFWADDGERVTIVEFEHEEGQKAWRLHPEHLEAQKQGRLKYYEMYDIKVAEVDYHRHYERKKAPAEARKPKAGQGLDPRPPKRHSKGQQTRP